MTGVGPRSVENAPTDRVSLPRATPPRLVRRAVRCRICGDTLEVSGRHDLAACTCGNAHLYGGLDHEARGSLDAWDSIEDLTEYAADA